MKKSFKKAGAAVLSMAMLLSMGAISMPVYAAPDATNTHAGEQRPGTVTVHITGLDTNAYHQGEGSGIYDTVNGEGPDTKAANAYETNHPGSTYTEKYKYLTLDGTDSLDFLKNIEEANVTMYQVATLTNNNGWDWVKSIKDKIGSSDVPGFTSFEALLANKDGREAVDAGHATAEKPQNTSNVTNELEFNTASTELQQLASYLERLVTELETDYVNAEAAVAGMTSTDAGYDTAVANRDALKAALKSIKVGEGKIDQSNKATGVTIPVISPAYLDATEQGGNNNGVLEQAEQVLTQNTIGYYLIVTKTDQAGTIVQPVLVSLKNNEDKNVSVKGSTIQFEKTMTAIYSTDEEANKGSNRFDSTAGSDLKNGLVAKDDIVNYEIVAQLPEYDPNVKQRNIVDFVIHDTASDGITILAPTVTGQTGEAATKIDPEQFEVYLAAAKNDLTDPTKRWQLTGSTSKNVGDYELKLDNDGHGFDLIISGYQMVQEDTRTQGSNAVLQAADGVVDTVAMIEGSGDATLNKQTLGLTTRFDTADVMDGETLVRAAQNKSGANSMYNMYVLVKFKAAVNKDVNGANVNSEDDLAFNRKFRKYAEVANVDAGMLNAVGETDLVAGGSVTADDVADSKKADALKQILRAQLFNGETRYNMTYKTEDYATTAADFTGLTPSDISALKGALEGTGIFTTVNDDWNVGTKPEDEMCRILVLLARDKHNIELNGDYNTAHLTYGNQYATGKNEVKMTTNYSKVYTVGLKLDKFIETLEIEGMMQVPETIVAYANFWDQNKDKTVSIPYTYSEGGETKNGTFETTLATIDAQLEAMEDGAAKTGLLSAIGSLNGTYPTTLTEDGATNEQKDKFKPDSDDSTALSNNAKKLMAYLIDQQNTEAGANGIYVQSENSGKKPVIGAIFHLTRIKENNDSNTATQVVKDYGYAVSNAYGNLIKLESVTQVTDKAAGEAIADVDGRQKFVFEDGGNWYVGYTGKTNLTIDGVEQVNYTGDNTWDMLDIGYYEISEIYVPTGFKKWDKARFEVKAEKDTAGDDLAPNSWTGAYSAEGLGIEAQTLTSSHGLASIAERTAGKVDFMYYNVSEGGAYTDAANYSDGYLYHELYNEYLDQLPATGGMGTVLFTAGGIAVILMAGALFVVYMKKRNAEEEE